MSDPNYWLQRWQDNNIKFNQDEVNPLLVKFIHEFNIKPRKKIFVPLCGKSIDMLWFLQQGHQVIGVELSEIACEAFFEKNKLKYTKTNLADFVSYSNDNVTLLAGDFFKLTTELLGEIDLIYDRAALIALPATLRDAYARKMIELASDYTQIFLITYAYEQSQMQGPPFSVTLMMAQALFGKEFNISVLLNANANKLPPHLVEKGLTSANELVLKMEK